MELLVYLALLAGARLPMPLESYLSALFESKRGAHRHAAPARTNRLRPDPDPCRAAAAGVVKSLRRRRAWSSSSTTSGRTASSFGGRRRERCPHRASRPTSSSATSARARWCRPCRSSSTSKRSSCTPRMKVRGKTGESRRHAPKVAEEARGLKKKVPALGPRAVLIPWS